jgi:hypothetical protein
MTDEIRFALLEGVRNPETEEERKYLQYMGGPRGPRNTWPSKWVECDTCHMEWQGRASFPSPTGNWIYPYRCPQCWQKWKEERARKAGIRGTTIRRPQ